MIALLQQLLVPILTITLAIRHAGEPADGVLTVISAVTVEPADWLGEPCLRHGEWGDTSPLKGCCRATFGCFMGTIEISAAYEMSSAAERRSSALR